MGMNVAGRGIVILVVVLLSVGCARKQEPAELYRIASHEASLGEWTIIQENKEQGTRVRIRAVCDFYQWHGHEAVQGRDSCDLIVGQTLIPNRLGTRPGEFLDVWQVGDKLFITRGDGADRVGQQFSIVSIELLQ